MLNKDLPDNTQFVIMMTDYCEPLDEYMPRQDCPDWGGWGGAAGVGVGYPATRPYNERSLCDVKIAATRWPREWVEYYKYLNRHNLEYAFDIANGIINNVSGQVQVLPPYDLSAYPEMPKVENLTHAGSIHIAEERKDNGVRIRTWKYTDIPNWDINFRNSVMISKFTGIMPGSGDYINLYSKADDCYLPVCVQDGKSAWIDAHEVEYFPPLGYVTVGSRNLIARSDPGVEYERVGIVYAGDVIPISRYHPSGYDVWGKCVFGWIPLRYQTTFGSQAYIEPTSWHLISKPGLKPWAHSIVGEQDYISPFADDEPIEGEPMLYKVKVICSALNVRTGPSVDYSKLYIVYKGDVLPVYEERDNWLRIASSAWCSGYSAYVLRIDETPVPVDEVAIYNRALDDAINAINGLRK